ncbi:MAG: hypothetical protein HZY76_16640 [Anaerolineae bacterium]|nr:MAG: hypothetical protein HZY76_16640 [Anaerolineae bacterium]
MADVHAALASGRIPVLVQPGGGVIASLAPGVVIDAIMAKTNTGTSLGDAPWSLRLAPASRLAVTATR